MFCFVFVFPKISQDPALLPFPSEGHREFYLTNTMLCRELTIVWVILLLASACSLYHMMILASSFSADFKVIKEFEICFVTHGVWLYVKENYELAF